MRVCQFRHFGTVRSRTDPLNSVVGIFNFCRPAGTLSNPSPQLLQAAAALSLRFLPRNCLVVVHWCAPGLVSCGPSKMGNSPKIPPDVATKLRSLAHDLSNAIETVMQAGYLLGQAKLDEETRKWVTLIDNASRDAARINREIRDILRAHSE